MFLSQFIKSSDKDTRKHMYLSNYHSLPTRRILVEKPACFAEYSCDKGKCSFDSVKKAISESIEVREYYADTFTLDVVETIENNPDVFLPHKHDAIQIYRSGFGIMFMKRKGSAGVGRTSFIEYDDVASVASEKYWKNKYNEKRMNSIATLTFFSLFN